MDFLSALALLLVLAAIVRVITGLHLAIVGMLNRFRLVFGSEFQQFLCDRSIGELPCQATALLGLSA